MIVQFGLNSDLRKYIFLYLSLKATSAEEGWLKISSFLMKLLIEFINRELLRNIPGSKKYRLDPIDFILDTSILAGGDPTVASYTGHTDNQDGLSHAL
jgi:hypothetical protein